MIDNMIYQLAEQLGEILTQRKMRCVVAESCTGGALAAAITDVPGSSQWFERGFVTYSNEAKQDMLAVPEAIIASQGAVSEATACAMAHGAIAASNAEVSIAITGIAGPGGGSEEKPVGTVWIAWAGDMQATYSHCYFFTGGREAIRQQAVQIALQGLIRRCGLQYSSQAQFVGKERYFFALWPDDKTAKELHLRAQNILDPSQCSPVILANLHLTLVYLGRVYPGFVERAIQIANQQSVAPFSLQITRANVWPQAKVQWFGMEVPPAELIELVTGLNHNLIAAGFKPEKTFFVPHVTIAKKSKQEGKLEFIAPLSWQVNDFCLVRSSATTGESRYEIIRRWSLKAKGSRKK